jgi:predicted enzyme related to lactoylglutathione lyase
MFGDTVWTIFKGTSNYFDKPFMINDRVADLDAMLAQLRAAGAQVDDKVEDTEFGRFGWAVDPEGNRIELWEPRGK